jgi:hypothetical protein
MPDEYSNRYFHGRPLVDYTDLFNW